jgi:hypothetical protein
VRLSCVQNNENFCFGVSGSVDGDDGGDGYSPPGDFELLPGGSDDWHGGDEDGSLSAGGGDGDAGETRDQTNRRLARRTLLAGQPAMS